MKLYDTMARRLRKFVPLKDNEVKLYTCGPTVYDYAHIGNLRSFIFDDTLRRVLCVSGYKVKHVMNITDVGHLLSNADEGDDKLEASASREKKSVWAVADYYIDSFIKDMDALNILPPNAYADFKKPYARATDFIKEQIDLVQRLVDKHYAYQTDGAIYFDITKSTDYGKLSGQKLSEKRIADRPEVVTDAAKRNPQDFGLWFFTKGRFAGHAMRWPSPWGEGFPGWHLECSAIVHAVLGDPIDIHTGGVDHIGTHHANEIAQTEAAYGHPLAKYWLHNEFLLVEGRRMAKSFGNYVTLKTLIDKGFDTLAFRLYCLQTHYRSQINFTWEGLASVQNNLLRIRSFADLRWQIIETNKRTTEDFFVRQRQAILTKAQHDLATSEALAELNRTIDLFDNKFCVLDHFTAEEFQKFIKFIDDLFGLDLLNSQDIDDNQKNIINKRESARLTKNYKLADLLRDNLKKSGLDINDTDFGPVWSRRG